MPIMSSEFVDPQIDRIPLSGENRWIDVRRELNAGEHDAMMASIVKDATADGNPIPDFEKTPSYRILAYLIDWSFTDSNGKPVPVSPASIANLKVKTRDEIAKAIDAHDDTAAKAIDARKKTDDDARESPLSLVSAER